MSCRPAPLTIAHIALQFLADLEQKLRPVGLKDRETLLALKKEEHDKKGLPFDGEFYLWDYRYYDRVFIERSLNLDDSLVKEYFPVSKVVPAILDIYQNLLGVTFVEVKGETWHPGKAVCLLQYFGGICSYKFCQMYRCSRSGRKMLRTSRAS